jgi:hypothetical protein
MVEEDTKFPWSKNKLQKDMFDNFQTIHIPYKNNTNMYVFCLYLPKVSCSFYPSIALHCSAIQYTTNLPVKIQISNRVNLSYLLM